jgi:hypothetical protein
MGLMVAIALWGTAYKLSLYHPHPAPSTRVQVAKLWLGNRTGFAVCQRRVSGMPGDRNRTRFLALAPQAQPAGRSVPVPWAADDATEKLRLAAESQVALRAPPSSQLCLD